MVSLPKNRKRNLNNTSARMKQKLLRVLLSEQLERREMLASDLALVEQVSSVFASPTSSEVTSAAQQAANATKNVVIDADSAIDLSHLASTTQPVSDGFGGTISATSFLAEGEGETGPRLLSIAPNSGVLFNTTPTTNPVITALNPLTESPTELVFRFDGAQQLDASTFRGIIITRSGGDGKFDGMGDTEVVPGYLGFGETNRIIIARFASALPDDTYRVEILGEAVNGRPALANIAGEPLVPRSIGTDRDTYFFNVELGVQVTAVVPQPTTANSTTGVVSRSGKTIEIHFDSQNDKLLLSASNTSLAIRQMFQLVWTKDTVNPNDDVVILPTTVNYDSDTNIVGLEFDQNIEAYAGGAGAFRLRIGSRDLAPSAAGQGSSPSTPLQFDLTVNDPSGTASGASNVIGTISGEYSALITQEIRVATASDQLLLNYPGSNTDPGSRDIQDESHIGIGNSADTNPEITKRFYTFLDNQAYGLDVNSRPVTTSISDIQKQRVREVFEFYSRYLGIDFTETTGMDSPDGSGPALQIVVGDLLGPVLGTSGPEGYVSYVTKALNDNPLGLEINLGILDGSESWDNDFGYGTQADKNIVQLLADFRLGSFYIQDLPVPNNQAPNFFIEAMRVVGSLLGLGQSNDLAPGTIQGFDPTLGRPANPLEQIFPGDYDIVHGDYLHRPDNRDTDLYRFEIDAGQSGVFTVETIAERLMNSSNVDTYVKLLREYTDSAGRLRTEVIAANNDYFSNDSFLKLQLSAGVYYIAVTASGNEDFNADIAGSGSGGTSQGRYQLRVDFKPNEQVNRLLRDRAGTPIDGDGDGQAGGVFDFWFRSAAPAGTQTAGAPKTIFVSKLYSGSNSNGSMNRPFRNIDDALAAANSGDIVRVIGNAGADGDFSTVADNRAYEIGTGGTAVGTLSDGADLIVPNGVTLMIDGGAILKFGRSRILVGSNDTTTDRSGAAIQVLGTPDNRVVFTSYTDESQGVDTNPLRTTPAKGDWGGIEIRNDFDNSQGRMNRERQGAFLNYIANADFSYGGGQVSVGGTPTVVNPIDLSEARATIINNLITKSADAAISADPNTFEETLFTEPRYQSTLPFTPDYVRVGPVIRGNVLSQNTINGLFVRVTTLAGQEPKKLTVAGRIDETSIPIVLGENLLVAGTPGGPIAETAGPNTTLVVPQSVAPTAPSTGLAAGTYSYVMTYVDIFGSESLPSPVFGTITLAANNAVRLTNLPTATGSYVGRKLYRRTGAGAFELVAEINRQQTSYVDQGTKLLGSIPTLGSTLLERARRDASLVIDPGVVVKSQGARIEVEFGAAMVAEGSDAKPIVFTSTRDDRYGSGTTFDTNGDGISITSAAPGDWSGILARHLSSLSLDSVIVTYAGGSSRVPGGFASFNAIEVHQAEARIANSIIENNASGVSDPGTTRRAARGVNDAAAIFVLGSQPIIVDNIIRNNSQTVAAYLGQFNQNGETAAISIDPNSMKAIAKIDYGRSVGLANATTYDAGNLGPLVHGNRLGGNAINGMRVRGGTLTTESVWDDTDIVHVLQKEILIPDFHSDGGMRLQSSAGESLVVKLQGPDAGFTATGRPLDITTRIGGSLAIVGTPGFPVVMTSLRDDKIGAGFDFAGRSMLDTNGDGAATVEAAGDWRGVVIDTFANDRNVKATYEFEARSPGAVGVNNKPTIAQEIGSLAPNMSGGDENLRLGISVTGTINSPGDLDVFKFNGEAGSMVWFDIDRTSYDLDTVVELLDAQERIIAQSDNSLTESINGNVLYFNTDMVSNDQVYPMDKEFFTERNANALQTAVDFQSTNPLDAGFRMTLPGTPGTRNDYFVRVRSSNLKPGDPLNQLRKASDLENGLTTGSYRLQIRLQQTDEVPGSTVQYATLRYATTAIDIVGGPIHSPLVGEFSEADRNEIQNGVGSAINIGNILEQDRGGASIAGQIASRTDVDWYRFTVQRQLSSNLQSQYHTSVVFDLDYADALGRANTSLWVFQGANGAPSNLVLIGQDSNIADDRAAPQQGTDTDDLSRGSFGNSDPFIGASELPPGEYFVAVTNNSLTANTLAQYELGQLNGANPLLRLEPIDSIQRIAEDRFDGTTTNPSIPKQVAFADAATNAVPYTLADVNLFVSRTNPNNGNQSQLLYANPMTGAKEAQGSNAGGIFSTRQVNDIAASPLGRIVGANVLPNGLVNDASTNSFTSVLTTGGAATNTSSGIQTFEARFNPQSNNPEFIRAIDASGQQNGIGLDFTALTFAQDNNQALAMFGVAHRADRSDFDRGNLVLINNAPAFAPTNPRLPDDAYIIPAVNNENDPNYRGGFRNILYRLDPNTQAGISPPNFGNRAGVLAVTGTGTQVREYGIFAEVEVYARSNLGNGNGDVGDTIIVKREATGDIVGITQMGAFIYGVTSTGELWRMAATNWDNGFQGAQLIATNVPNGLTGLTHGPRNLSLGTNVNEQILQVPAVATGGTLQLSVGGNLTAVLPYNATAAQVQAALAALPNVGAGNVRVTGGPLASAGVSITFIGALAAANPTVTIANQSLVRAGNPPTIQSLNNQANAFDLIIDRNDVNNITVRVNADTFQATGNSGTFASANALQNAINALNAVAAVPATAVVTQLASGRFRVVFQGAGANTLALSIDNPNLAPVAPASLTAIQSSHDLVIDSTSPGVVRLNVGGLLTTPTPARNITSAADVQALVASSGITPSQVEDLTGGNYRVRFIGGGQVGLQVQNLTSYEVTVDTSSTALANFRINGLPTASVPGNTLLTVPDLQNLLQTVDPSVIVTRVNFNTPQRRFLVTFPNTNLINFIVGGTASSVVANTVAATSTQAAERNFLLNIDPSIATGTFTLTLGGDTTAAFGVNVTVGQLQLALRTLPAVAILGQDVTINVLPSTSGINAFNIVVSGPAAKLLGDLTIGSHTFGESAGVATITPQQIQAYEQVLFAATPNGTLHAFDVAGIAQTIFPGGISSTVTNNTTDGLSNSGSDVSGLDFAALDVNLWHQTDTRAADAGHGTFQTFNTSRLASGNGGNSLYFGFRDNTIGNRQPGTWDGIYDIATGIGANGGAGNYNLPGGARGALESNPIDLSGYSADDLPMLYFNYFISTEASNSNATDNNVMRDSFRVYGLATDGTWIELATNNSAGNTDQNLGLLTDVNEYDVPVSGNVDPFGRSNRTQEIFDEAGTTGTWRQSRINLSPFAGMSDLVLRFEFSTSGEFRTGDPDRGGIEIIAKEGSKFVAGDNFTLNVNGTLRTYQFVVGSEALIPGATRINVNATMTAQQVRDAIRLALANSISGNSNTVPYPVYGNTVVIYKATVVNPGPLKITQEAYRQGDLFGPYNGLTTTKNFDRAMQAGFNNTFEGVFIDDIIIGFAERGEQVFNPTPSGGDIFVNNPFYEAFGAPTGGAVEQVELGTYQLEIRTGIEYGDQGGGRIVPDYLTPRVVDTNDRLAKQTAIVVSKTIDVVDGDTFQISDGTTSIVFEFDVTGNGVASGRVAVPLVYTTQDASARAGIVARAIRDAINGSVSQGALRGITASVRGQMKNAFNNDLQQDFSNIVEIFGPATGDIAGSQGFGGTAALSTFVYGQNDVFYGEDLGDSNIAREQGQIIIDSNTITDSLQFGIVLGAGLQLRDDLGVNITARPYPGSVRNLITLNNENLVTGAVIQNNVLASNVAGGIHVEGDPGVGAPAEPAIAPIQNARIYNNTIYGFATASSTGILVENATKPTLINNIIANTNEGLVVRNGATVVQGGNLFKANNTPRVGVGAGTFEIILGAAESLFENVTNGRFYLAADSKAIDASIGSLQELPGLTQVKSGVQISSSPLLAPIFDVGGLRRVDDPLVNTPVGQGSNVFIDRGAVDRSDFIGPGVTLTRPIDNDLVGIDLDPAASFLRLAPNSSPVDYFELLIDERSGTGPDPETVISSNVILTENGRTLTAGVEYEFGYSANSRTIRLTPLAGLWNNESVYEITLDNQQISDLAGNLMTPNRIDGSTKFTILMPNVAIDFGDAPDPFNGTNGEYPTLSANGGAAHVIFDGGLVLGTGVSKEDDGQPTADASGDNFDDGVTFTAAADFPVGFNSSGLLGRQITNQVTVTLNAPGFVNGWIDFNADGDWDDQGEQVVTGEQFSAGNLTRTFDITIPADAAIGLNPIFVFGRFRASTDAQLLPTGYTVDGEVEDYRLTLLPLSNPPVAKADSYSLPLVPNAVLTTTDPRGTVTQVTSDDGVLANDSDIDGDLSRARLVSTPVRGSVVFNNNGTFTYTPPANAVVGQKDTFVYEALDATGKASQQTTVTITFADRGRSPHQNPDNRFDVVLGSAPGVVSPIDALSLVNFLRAIRPKNAVPVSDLTYNPEPFRDVNGDFIIGVLDLLDVINELNRQRGSVGGEGEGASVEDATVIDVMAIPPVSYAANVVTTVSEPESVGDSTAVGAAVSAGSALPSDLDSALATSLYDEDEEDSYDFVGASVDSSIADAVFVDLSDITTNKKR